MAIDEKKFKRLKQQAEEARTARDQAAGQLAAAMQHLQDKFEFDDLDEAERMVEVMETEAKAAEAKYDKIVIEFEQSWEHLINDEDEE